MPEKGLWTPGQPNILRTEKSKDEQLEMAGMRIMQLSASLESLKANGDQLTRVLAYVIDEHCEGEVEVPSWVLSDRSSIPYQDSYDEDTESIILKTKLFEEE